METGKRKTVGEEGELWIKSPLRMKGYMGDPAASEALLDQEGYVRTGDIGHYDNEGAFYFVDRLKELIKYNGFQVAPAELEALLLQHPGVAEAGVVGAPHESAGELPTAFVVRQPGAAVTERELQDHVASKDALTLGINGACRGIEMTNNITINNNIVTFKMRDTKTKTTKSFVIRDEIMNKFKNNPRNIVFATNTIKTAKSHEDVHNASSASHQPRLSLNTDPQPGSRDPPVNIEHYSPDKIKIDTKPESSSTLPFANYLYCIIIILSLSTTTVHSSQIGDCQQSALGGSNSQFLLPSQREGRASEQSTSDTASLQPGSVSNIQQTNIRGPDGTRTVTITGSPNMSNVNVQSNNGPGGSRTVTITDSPNMSNVNFQYNNSGTITLTMTSCPNMSNVNFIFNAGPGSTITFTLTNCPNMSKVSFIFNAAPGRIITVSLTDRPNMSNAEYVYN
ncbi:uncharacterized protein LOC134748305 isoform X2 [Cydia strobilella]|uniref:uncharacterized protein LOC134748305 isoform X2 n=1 Tax=Cydia strobilella TaxID=1100964 RepID=UPI00300781D5